jgi:hypothetical protein
MSASRKLGTVCETSEKGGLPFGRKSDVKCQVGVKIAGQIKRAMVDRTSSGQVRPDRSCIRARASKHVHGLRSRQPYAGPEQLG